MRGYTPAFMLLDGAYTNVCRGLPRVFGPQNAAGIKVQSCVHLAATGLKRPVFNLVLQGVPGDWQGDYIRSMDSRPTECGKGSCESQGGRSTGRLGSGTIWCRQTLPRVTQMH